MNKGNEDVIKARHEEMRYEARKLRLAHWCGIALMIFGIMATSSAVQHWSDWHAAGYLGSPGPSFVPLFIAVFSCLTAGSILVVSSARKRLALFNPTGKEKS